MLVEIKQIPRFQTWEMGALSNRLFVKNLAKRTTEADLMFLFGRYSVSGLLDDVSIRLMTKGKMHGQSFVVLANENMAQKAMNEVLGFLLHDRPVILVCT